MKEKTYETIIEMLVEEVELLRWRNERLEEENRNLIKATKLKEDKADEQF